MQGIALSRKLTDLFEQCREKNIITHTDFLDPMQRAEARTIYKGCNVLESGGFKGFERGVVFFLPDYLEPDDIDVGEYISAVKIKPTDKATYSHRDYLGGIMSLGIARGKLGDILVYDDHAIVLGFKPIITYISEQLERISRAVTTCETIPLHSITAPEKKAYVSTRTVASMRADSVCGAAFGLSRARASEVIKEGLFHVNWLQATKNGLTINSGDIISVRGMGRAVIEISGESKKSRIFITITKYEH